MMNFKFLTKKNTELKTACVIPANIIQFNEHELSTIVGGCEETPMNFYLQEESSNKTFEWLK
jgi:hypothetical protein